MDHLDPKRLGFVIYLGLPMQQFEKYCLLRFTVINNNTWETSAWMFEIVQHFLGIRQCPKGDKGNTNALSFYTGFLSLHFGNIIWFFLFVKSQGIGRISTATTIARAANNSASTRFHLLSRAKLCRMRLAIKFCPSWIFSFLIQPSEFRHVISNLNFFYNSIIAAIEKKIVKSKRA